MVEHVESVRLSGGQLLSILRNRQRPKAKTKHNKAGQTYRYRFREKQLNDICQQYWKECVHDSVHVHRKTSRDKIPPL